MRTFPFEGDFLFGNHKFFDSYTILLRAQKDIIFVRLAAYRASPPITPPPARSTP